MRATWSRSTSPAALGGAGSAWPTSPRSTLTPGRPRSRCRSACARATTGPLSSTLPAARSSLSARADRPASPRRAVVEQGLLAAELDGRWVARDRLAGDAVEGCVGAQLEGVHGREEWVSLVDAEPASALADRPRRARVCVAVPGGRCERRGPVGEPLGADEHFVPSGRDR